MNHAGNRDVSLSGRTIFNTVAASTLALSLLIAASGCTNSKTAPTPANFIQALNAYYLEHPDCLLANTRFPYETTDKAKTLQMDSLVKTLLLTKEEEQSIHASRYTISAAGARFAPNFCYGHREVTSIDSSTPLAVVNGFKETTLTFHYAMKDVPVWTKTPEVLAAFPQMAQATTGESTASSALAQTMAGWEVPD
jgi:hypothetical protein